MKRKQKHENPNVHLGTPIEIDSNLKYQSIYNQEVRDEKGRKRFHGAFTGGFSAGYYNTVGSKEDFQPKTFISSRKEKMKYEQNIFDYMDSEDLKELENSNIQTKDIFQYEMKENDCETKDNYYCIGFNPKSIQNLNIEKKKNKIMIKDLFKNNEKDLELNNYIIEEEEEEKHVNIEKNQFIYTELLKNNNQKYPFPEIKDYKPNFIKIIEKRNENNNDISEIMKERFTKDSIIKEEIIDKKKRLILEWKPDPLLFKRFQNEK